MSRVARAEELVDGQDGTHLFLQAHDAGPFFLEQAFVFLDRVVVEQVFWQGEFLSQGGGGGREVVR